VVMDGCGRHTRLDQLDPPSIRHLVIGRRRDTNGPAKVMGDSDTHTKDSASRQQSLAGVGSLLAALSHAAGARGIWPGSPTGVGLEPDGGGVLDERGRQVGPAIGVLRVAGAADRLVPGRGRELVGAVEAIPGVRPIVPACLTLTDARP